MSLTVPSASHSNDTANHGDISPRYPKETIDRNEIPEPDVVTKTRSVTGDTPFSVFTRRQKWTIVVLVSIAGIFRCAFLARDDALV